MPWGAVAGAVVGAVANAALAPDGSGGGGGQADAAAASAALKQAEISEKQWKYYEDNFQPYEKNALLPAGYDLLEAAKGFGSQAEQDKAAGEASAAIALAQGKAKASLERNMASYGINPASGRFQDANLKMALSGATADAGAQSLARKGVRDLAFSKKLDSISAGLNIDAVGRGLPATALSGLSSAAATNASIGNNQFQRDQYLQSQARAGLAPIGSAISKGVTKWFETPSSPVDTYDGYTGRARANGFNFTDMTDPAYG